MTEHFGALRANVPLDGAPETGMNKELVTVLGRFENIIIAGEAKSHCVANTVKQIMETKEIKGRLIILDDCMSNVTGFEHIADPIYKKALERGALITQSTDLVLN